MRERRKMSKNFIYLLLAGTISFFCPCLSEGISNLEVNDSSSLITLTTADTLYITADFESGNHIGNVIFYYDLDGDGILDANESWIIKKRLIDGNFDDDDALVNGSITRIHEPITITGRFLLYAEDNGVSDTVPIKVDPVTSSLSVSGKVNTPANTPHIFVGLSDTLYGTECLYGDFTDASGNYEIFLPSVLQDSTMSLSAMDMVGVLPPYYMSSPTTPVQVTGALIRDIDIFNASGMDSTIVFGTVKDNLGNPVTDPVQIVGGVSPGGVSYGVRRITNTSGQFGFTAPKYNPGYYLAGTGVVDQFYPQFLDPLYAMKVIPGLPACTLNIIVYNTTDSICGTVYKSGSPYRYAQIDIGAVYPTGLTGGTYTKTYSDGHYVAYVSTSVFIYSVRVSPKSVPQGYVVIEGDTMKASPGATGIDFHISSVGVAETEGFEIRKEELTTYPNPFFYSTTVNCQSLSGTDKMQIYDISGKLVKETEDNIIGQDLNPGIYFIKFRNFEKTKIIKF